MLTPEQEAVVRSIRKLVDFWQISADELAGVLAPVSSLPVVPPAPVGPKYRHPRSGETWDGVGSQPQWLREALTKQGYTVDELKADSRLNRESMGGGV